jgi:hypothetical protein
MVCSCTCCSFNFYEYAGNEEEAGRLAINLAAITRQLKTLSKRQQVRFLCSFCVSHLVP